MFFSKKHLKLLEGCGRVKVLVTGCTGFIGRFLSNTLALNHEVVGVCRKGVSTCLINYKVYEVDDYFSYQNWAMVKDSPNIGIGTGTVTMRGDSRVLPAGTFLRKTKINELPQMLNIFFGYMSVIDPRPLTTQIFGAYSDSTQRLITQVRPGLSGVGSIIFRGEEEIMHGATASVDFYANVIAPYKGAHEEWFVSNKSLFIYFLAIFVTAWAVLIPSTKIAWRVFYRFSRAADELKYESCDC